LPASLHEALKAAVKAGMNDGPNDALANAMRDRLQAFAQRLALDLRYERFPDARPSLTEMAIAAARHDDHPLAEEPDLLRQAASEVAVHKPDADADDVLICAAALQSGRTPGDKAPPTAAAS
jgi:hypothetical protein